MPGQLLVVWSSQLTSHPPVSFLFHPQSLGDGSLGAQGLQPSLYGAECWILLRKHARKLNTFHHGCVRIILGISNKQQWSEHITVAEVRRRCGDEETAAEKVLSPAVTSLVGSPLCVLY